MEVEVRRFLSAKDPVVLKRQYPERVETLDERLCDSLSRHHYRCALLDGKIQQRRDGASRGRGFSWTPIVGLLVDTHRL
jgi:hypothetical protein